MTIVSHPGTGTGHRARRGTPYAVSSYPPSTPMSSAYGMEREGRTA